MFTLTTKPIDAAALTAALAHPAAGACATFEGWVRDHNEGSAVRSLEYEAFAELADHEGAAILQEACARHAVLGAHCVHRVGHLQIGELAVWVGVIAPHRDAAFRACREIIDAVKARVPIWKKEHYVDGRAEWVNCAACAAHGHGGHEDRLKPVLPTAVCRADSGRAEGEPGEAAYYRRQVALPQVGEAGQRRLKAARVLVVGAGGLGCPALQYLAAAGVGTIIIRDGDAVDVSNLHRQVLFQAADVGRNKAEVAAERLRAQNPFINVDARGKHVDLEGVRVDLAGCDLVLDCTDNFRSKFLLHDACQAAQVPLVQAALYQFDGQLQVFRPGSGAGCLRCLWPEVPEEGCVGTCADVGVLGVVPGVLGAMQAAEALKLILGLPGVCDRETLLIDVLTLEIRRVVRDRNPRCPNCGRDPAPAPATPVTEGDWMVDARELTRERVRAFHVVDIRGPAERVGDPDWIQQLPNIEWTDLDGLAQLDPRENYLLACAHGIRARSTVARLRKRGHANFYTLRQGIGALGDVLRGD